MKPLPTPEEIRERAAAIQAGWTDAEWKSRAGLPAAPVRVETARYRCQTHHGRVGDVVFDSIELEVMS